MAISSIESSKNVILKIKQRQKEEEELNKALNHGEIVKIKNPSWLKKFGNGDSPADLLMFKVRSYVIVTRAFNKCLFEV